MHEPLVIFEIGINHLGSKARALRMVDTLITQGAMHLTIQAQIAPLDYNRDPAAAAKLAPLCLSLVDVLEVVSHARDAGVQMGAVPFDPDDVEALRQAGVSFFKILSSDITFTPLHVAAARTGVPVYLSTAASEVGEIAQAVARIHALYPRADVRLIHTVFPAPMPPEVLNLSAIRFLRREVGISVSYGQHAVAPEAMHYAIAAGAENIFVYVAEEPDSRLPDGPHAIRCVEAGALLKSIERTWAMMGPDARIMTSEEAILRPRLRRSVVAAYPIAKGEIITRDAVKFKRPGTGRPVWDIDQVVGNAAARDYKLDEDII